MVVTEGASVVPGPALAASGLSDHHPQPGPAGVAERPLSRGWLLVVGAAAMAQGAPFENLIPPKVGLPLEWVVVSSKSASSAGSDLAEKTPPSEGAGFKLGGFGKHGQPSAGRGPDFGLPPELASGRRLPDCL